jgi:hypothetical protein
MVNPKVRKAARSCAATISEHLDNLPADRAMTWLEELERFVQSLQPIDIVMETKPKAQKKQED